MYQLKVEEYQVRDYVLEANGTKLSFRPRTTDQLIQGLALKIRGALHRSIQVDEFPELDLITIRSSDKRVGCLIHTEDPKLILEPLDPERLIRGHSGSSSHIKEDLIRWYDSLELDSRYLLISHSEVSIVEERINFLMGKGWEPSGALISHGHLLVQTMVRMAQPESLLH